MGYWGKGMELNPPPQGNALWGKCSFNHLLSVLNLFPIEESQQEIKGICLLQTASDVLLRQQAGGGLCWGLGTETPSGAEALGMS